MRPASGPHRACYTGLCGLVRCRVLDARLQVNRPFRRSGGASTPAEDMTINPAGRKIRQALTGPPPTAARPHVAQAGVIRGRPERYMRVVPSGARETPQHSDRSDGVGGAAANVPYARLRWSCVTTGTGVASAGT